MKKIIFGLIIILLFSTCQSILEKEPLSTIVDENFFQQEKDALSAVVAIYDVLQFEFDEGVSDTWYSHSLWHFGDIVSDDADKGGQNDADGIDILRLSNFEGNSGIAELLAVWNINYQGIARANFAIEGISNMPEDVFDTIRTREHYVSETRFLRALFYFNLVKMFGGIVLFNQTPAPSEYNNPRSTVEEIWTFIEEELAAAAEILPRKSEYLTSEYGRATRGAAMSFLARAHLFQNEYAETMVAAEDVINSGEYSLIDNYQNIFEVTGEHGQGSIFEVNFTNTIASGWPPNGSEGSVLHTFFRSRSEAIVGWGWNIPTQDLYDEFEANDARRSATIISNGDRIYGQIANNSHQYHNRKFRLRPEDEPAGLGNGGDATYSGPTNLRLMRYADVLLMYAEAAAREGDEGIAQDALNQVRQRARQFVVLQNSSLAGNANVLPDVNSSGEQLINDIWHERRVELAMEGHRFFDIVRQGRAGEVMRAFGKNFVDGVNEVFPIPLRAITSTSGAVEQNPGY